jgi:hypothetical protein
MATISTNAGVPSCIRVPPEDVATSSGRRSRVARVDRGDDPCGGGAPDGPAEEAELAHDDGDLVAADAPGAGDDGFVDAGPRVCPRELLRVAGSMPEVSTGVSQPVNVPSSRTSRDQAASIQAGAHAVAPSVSQARTVTPSPSNVWGAEWVVCVTS